jgi:3-oxoacyl-(acyl-carrier-protein) synthase
MNGFPGIVLTGIGLVSPAGTNKQDFFRYLKEATLPDAGPDKPTAPGPGRLLSMLNITEPRLKISRYMDPISRNVIVAMGRAMTDAGLEERVISAAPFDYGIVLGTTRGPCVTREGLYDSLASRQGRLVSATLFSHCGYNIAGAMAAIAFGIKGPNLTVADRGDLGLSVLRRTRQFLISGRAHTIFAGFAECPGATRREDVPVGEFAYLLCLERKDRAVERGAVILSELSLQDEETGAPNSDSGPLPDTPETDPLHLDCSQTPVLNLPGLRAFGERYLSLFLIGLWSHDCELRGRVPAIVARAGRARSKVGLFCREEQSAAA